VEVEEEFGLEGRDTHRWEEDATPLFASTSRAWRFARRVHVAQVTSCFPESAVDLKRRSLRGK